MGKWDTFDGILSETWTMLEHGAASFKDPFHWPVLGTVGEDTCNMRTVILRQLILPDRRLVCHTDTRAGKVQEIKRNNRVSWLFYHPKKKIQLRISGMAELHVNDSFADKQWADASVATRLNFSATKAPGTPIDKPASGLPDFMINKLPTLLESEKSRNNFLSISCRIDSMDWVLLSTLGNRRASFNWKKNKLNSSWLVP